MVKGVGDENSSAGPGSDFQQCNIDQLFLQSTLTTGGVASDHYILLHV